MIETSFLYHRLDSNGIKIARVRISDFFWEFLKAYTYTTSGWPNTLLGKQKAYKLRILPAGVQHMDLNCTEEELMAEKQKLQYLKSYLGASVLYYFNPITQILLRVTEVGDDVQAQTERRADNWKDLIATGYPDLFIDITYDHSSPDILPFK